MVARYFAPSVIASELYELLGTSRDGTRQTAIVRGLRTVGVSANIRYDVDFDRLRQEINRGKPVISYLFDDEHWVVVYGHAASPDRVFVADPRPGHTSEYPWSTYGSRLGRFGIVCSAQASRSRETAPPPPIQSSDRLLPPSPMRLYSTQLGFDFDFEPT